LDLRNPANAVLNHHFDFPTIDSAETVQFGAVSFCFKNTVTLVTNFHHKTILIMVIFPFSPVFFFPSGKYFSPKFSFVRNKKAEINPLL
jgi:hypothetical protein